MSARRTPILLRRAPMSGDIVALHRYTHKTIRGRDVIDSGIDGKQSVQADFDALVLEALLDPDSPDMAAILDGVADGYELNADERRQVRAFRERLVALINRHNTTGHGAGMTPDQPRSRTER